MADYLLTTAEAAERLKLAEITMRKLRLKGDGPSFVKLGRAVRYRPVDLDAWVAARLITSTSEAE
jgi:excisionase family DNA binding protein